MEFAVGILALPKLSHPEIVRRSIASRKPRRSITANQSLSQSEPRKYQDDDSVRSGSTVPEGLGIPKLDWKRRGRPE